MCNCFTCRHSNNIDVLYGYYKADYEAHKMCYEYLKNLGYSEGSLSDKEGIPRLMAILNYEKMSSGCSLKDVESKFNLKKDLYSDYLLNGDGYTF